MEDEPAPTLLLKDVIKQLPAETQEYVLKLHQRFIDSNFKCLANNDLFESMGYYFWYVHESKLNIRDNRWILRVTPNACDIRLDAKHANKHADIFEKFPKDILGIIKNGKCGPKPTPVNCERKKEFIFVIDGVQYAKCADYCCGGNEFWIPLLNLTNERVQAIEKWIEMEFSYK